ELLEQHHGAADVDQRVERTELVEVNIVTRHAMDASFDLGESLEHAECASAGSLRKIGRLDEPANRPIRPVVVVVRGVHPEMQSSDALPLDTLDNDLHALEGECGGHPAKRLELGPRVEQGGEEHVAR